ncbi:hypothetical protein [Paenibacillus sp. YYML68]|uniref:hypothetical protein n=1 Tax=Paenibacillus sp. YYML68 TaxID=2909250 RepID=UPI0024935CAB|nr:hypothetical protein [Paenibacillus sp. YYML68]
MNTLFMMLFALYALLLVSTNYRHWSASPKSLRRVYLVLCGATFALYVCLMIGYEPPMPTSYMIEHLSPWVFEIFHGS